MAKKSSGKKKTQVTVSHESNYNNLAYGLFAVAMTYGFASWAIDSGSLWHYFFTIVSAYYAGYFFIKQFRNHDNSRKTSKARRA